MFFGTKPGSAALGHLPGGRHFPHQAVIERELLQPLSAQAIDAAVAYVGGQGSLRQEQQRAGGGSHALKIGIGLAAIVNLGVDFFDAFSNCVSGRQIAVLEIGVRNAFRGHLAGEFAGRVGTHAVTHDKHVPATKPVVHIGRSSFGMRILIVGATHADIGQCDVFQAIVPSHSRCHARALSMFFSDAVIASTQTHERIFRKDEVANFKRSATAQCLVKLASGLAI